MNTLADRIKQARTEAALSQTELAKRVRVSRAAVSQWENGSTQKLEGENLVTVSNVLQVNATWLATGNGESKKFGVAESAEPYIATRNIPIISWVQAGEWHEAYDQFHPGDAEDWLSIDGNFSRHAFALTVKGDSMTSPTPPSIPNGSTIVVDPNSQPDHGSLVVAKLTDTNEVTFKRLVIDGSRRYLEPLNPRYQPIEINGNCIIVGVVKRAVMSF